MARVSVANRQTVAKLSWLLLRSGLRQLAGRIIGHPMVRWPLLAAQGRPAPDRAAGSAYRRRHPRKRNLFRTFRLRRQGRGLRRPLDFRNDAAVGGLGDGIVGLQLAAPSARRRIPALPAPMRARWSTNGSRCRAPGIRSPGAPTCCRGASSLGSAKRRSSCKMLMCVSTGASCAAWCGKYVICATPRARPVAAWRACRPRSRCATPRSASPVRPATSKPPPRG